MRNVKISDEDLLKYAEDEKARIIKELEDRIMQEEDDRRRVKKALVERLMRTRGLTRLQVEEQIDRHGVVDPVTDKGPFKDRFKKIFKNKEPRKSRFGEMSGELAGKLDLGYLLYLRSAKSLNEGELKSRIKWTEANQKEADKFGVPFMALLTRSFLHGNPHRNDPAYSTR